MEEKLARESIQLGIHHNQLHGSAKNSSTNGHRDQASSIDALLTASNTPANTQQSANLLINISEEKKKQKLLSEARLNCLDHSIFELDSTILLMHHF